MTAPRHTDSGKVSLEQLIQLKRAEKPPAEFWEDFDRELHRRQLAALVTVEPWHRRVGRVLSSVARRIVPAGAGVTALAFAVLAVLRMEPTQPSAADATASAAPELDTRVILLPEEAISVSGNPAHPARVQPATEVFRGNVRSAPQELAAGLATARRFVAVSAPVTFSSEGDSSAIYSAKALTAGTVLRTMASAVPESL